MTAQYNTGVVLSTWSRPDALSQHTANDDDITYLPLPTPLGQVGTWDRILSGKRTSLKEQAKCRSYKHQQVKHHNGLGKRPRIKLAPGE